MTTSAAFVNTADNKLVDPLNVCVFVNEFAAVVTGILALANVVAPVPPFAIGNVPVTFVVREQYVVDVDPVPPFAIGNVPVMPVDNGNPVQFVNVPDAGVCRIRASAV